MGTIIIAEKLTVPYGTPSGSPRDSHRESLCDFFCGWVVRRATEKQLVSHALFVLCLTGRWMLGYPITLFAANCSGPVSAVLGHSVLLYNAEILDRMTNVF